MIKVRFNREPRNDREFHWVINLEKQLLSPRKCLKCDKVFSPDGKFNRLCINCNEANSLLAPMKRIDVEAPRPDKIFKRDS